MKQTRNENVLIGCIFSNKEPIMGGFFVYFATSEQQQEKILFPLSCCLLSSRKATTNKRILATLDLTDHSFLSGKVIPYRSTSV